MDWNGYGLYWAILEMLRNESTYKLPLNKNTYRAIKMQTGTSIDIEKYLNDCINEYRDEESRSGLFNTDGKTFWSASLLRRMEKYENLKEKRSQAANARWNKEKEKQKQEKPKKCKSIKGICKSNASAYKKRYKCNAKLKKVYAKLCKLNQIKLNEIKLNKIKSIYPSNHVQEEITKMEMDEMEKMEFERIVSNCELHILDPSLAIEIKEILRELYLDLKTRKKIEGLNSKMILYALQQFSIANTKTKIKKPKPYFKKCILSAGEQTELSMQYDANTIYEIEGVGYE